MGMREGGILLENLGVMGMIRMVGMVRRVLEELRVWK